MIDEIPVNAGYQPIKQSHQRDSQQQHDGGKVSQGGERMLEIARQSTTEIGLAHILEQKTHITGGNLLDKQQESQHR